MRNGGLVAKKPCRVCRKFYRPNARVGDRQKTCGLEDCRKTWKQRKNQAAYRKARGYHRGQALRDKLAAKEIRQRKEPGQTRDDREKPGLLQLPREEIREALGAETLVVLEYLVTLIIRYRRGCLW